ncbi:MAG TPA: nuclear transport factor 2 family protein [Acidimicrobiales bacterium]|nr:nuclear transport factor 2 family protein [Acidimicrobiales bacterium]
MQSTVGNQAVMGVRELAETSLRLTKEGDRDGWLALFTDDAVVEDPVGVSPFDGGVGGNRGKEAIARFRDNVISRMEDFEYEIERVYVCGDEAAAVVTFHITSEGHKMDMDVVNIYTTDGKGKLTSLRSFWDGSLQGGQNKKTQRKS